MEAIQVAMIISSVFNLLFGIIYIATSAKKRLLAATLVGALAGFNMVAYATMQVLVKDNKEAIYGSVFCVLVWVGCSAMASYRYRQNLE